MINKILTFLKSTSLKAWVSALLALAVAAGGVVALTANETDDKIQQKTVEVLETIEKNLPDSNETDEEVVE